MRAVASIILFACMHAAAWAQSGFSVSIGAVLDVTVNVESKTEPQEPDVLRGPSGVTFLGKVRPQGISRYIADTKTHEYTGYDMKLEAVKPGQYRVTFSPLTLSPNDIGLPTSANWHLAHSPLFPRPELVTTSDTLVLEVMENSTTGQKIVDYIQLKRRNCDALENETEQIPCLSAIVEETRRELHDKLNRAQAHRGGATLQAIITSQQSWSRYKDDACSPLETEAKRLNCEIDLTRSRIHDLHVF